jgi:beta-glucoside operon transcriptional antiterminator
MLVVRAINNNVVSCVDDAGQELIAMGRGLGYRAAAGGVLDESQVEKVFRMDTQRETDRLKDLLAEMPPEQVDLCARIIAYATETLGKRLSESIYLTLTDHIGFAITRQQQGMTFQNALVTEVRIFYPGEFAVGRRALEMIRAELSVELPEDEAASIALHLVNAEYDSSISVTMRVTQALHEIVAFLKSSPGIAPDEGSLYYDECIVHLKFMALRAFTGAEPPRAEAELVKLAAFSYPKEYACAKRITAYLAKRSLHPLEEEQAAYLAVLIRMAEHAEPKT